MDQTVDPTTMMMIFFVFSFLFGLIFLAIVIFELVAMGKVFAKAGRNPWLVLVPFYNIIVTLQIGGYSGWFILLILIPYVGPIALTIMQSIGLGKKFNKGTGFIVGLILLSVVFIPILGFGSSQYQKETPQIPQEPEPTLPQA